MVLELHGPLAEPGERRAEIVPRIGGATVCLGWPEAADFLAPRSLVKPLLELTPACDAHFVHSVHRGTRTLQGSCELPWASAWDVFSGPVKVPAHNQRRQSRAQAPPRCPSAPPNRFRGRLGTRGGRLETRRP